MREAVLSDLAQIAAVARAAGQDEKRGGAAAYITHLLAHGRVVVGVSGGSVVGFAPPRAIGSGGPCCTSAAGWTPCPLRMGWRAHSYALLWTELNRWMPRFPAVI